MSIQRVQVNFDDFSGYTKSVQIAFIHPNGSRTGYDAYCPINPAFTHKSIYRGKVKTNNAIGKLLKDL